MKKKMHKYNYIVMIFSILILFIFCVMMLSGYTKMKSMSGRIQESEVKIADMEIQIQSSLGAADQTEYIKAIEFLENETVKYREFIQDQQEYLIWLLGVIGAAFLALMTFLGFESRKNISDMFKEQYAKLVKEEIASMIGGMDKEEYLVRCVEKEEQAKKRKILFLKQMEQDEDFEKIYDYLEEQEYCVSEKVIREFANEREINCLVKKYDVVIYQVGQSEYKKNMEINEQAAGIADAETGKDEERNYVKIARQCNEKGVYGIFYCAGGKRINLDKCDFPFYVSSVNFGATLLERINSVLYFTQG